MKTAVITGANEGIGYYLAKEQLAEGKSVAVLDIRLDHICELAKEYPGTLLCLQCDVQDEAQVAECAKTAAEKFGALDYAIHNACKCSFKAFKELSSLDFEEIMRVNFFGAVNLTKAVLPYMVKQHSGEIYFTSSGVGVTGFRNISPYACSKGAIEAFAKCMLQEYREYGIHFHLFHPPLTKTASASPLPVPDNFKANPETVGKGLARNIDKKRFIISHSGGQALQTKLMYLFPIRIGTMMTKMTDRTVKQ